MEIGLITPPVGLNLYIIKGKSKREIVKKFLKIIGRSYVPPKWAFGFQQCRWSYEDAKEVEEVADNFIKHDIPCDTIYLDIDYMEDFKDFFTEIVSLIDALVLAIL